MKRKWSYILTGLFFSMFIITGCNTNDDMPPPPRADNQEDTNQEKPSVKEPTKKAEDLLDDGSKISEEEKQRDQKIEENIEKNVEELE